jgi:hypothetical protein
LLNFATPSKLYAIVVDACYCHLFCVAKAFRKAPTRS